MKRHFIILFCLPLLLTTCKSYTTRLQNSIDPDIILINIEQGDRVFIGKVLLKLDSLHPLVIGIDVTFQGRKKNDSTLITALEKLNNDILVYNVKQDSLINGSDSVFTNVAAQGNLYYEQRLGLITTIVPLLKSNNNVHESFALKIIKQWKPGFTSEIKINQKIDIYYKRNLEKFFVINGSELLSTNVADLDLRNKVFLVGYTGPGNEDKHFTPLRHVDKEFKTNEPDTYGLVIIANEIRTILEYKK